MLGVLIESDGAHGVVQSHFPEDCAAYAANPFHLASTLRRRGSGEGRTGAGSKQVLPFASFPSFGASLRKDCKASLDGRTHF